MEVYVTRHAVDRLFIRFPHRAHDVKQAIAHIKKAAKRSRLSSRCGEIEERQWGSLWLIIEVKKKFLKVITLYRNHSRRIPDNDFYRLKRKIKAVDRGKHSGENVTRFAISQEKAPSDSWVKLGYFWPGGEMKMQQAIFTDVEQELNTVTKRVEALMNEKPACRNSDKILIIEYFRKYHGVAIPKMILDGGMPAFETVRRSRQRIQREGKFLPEASIQTDRDKREKNTRNYFRAK
ncbi:MAG: hypothetical protein ACYCX4_03850 [Bacillota bacterium]